MSSKDNSHSMFVNAVSGLGFQEVPILIKEVSSSLFFSVVLICDQDQRSHYVGIHYLKLICNDTRESKTG